MKGDWEAGDSDNWTTLICVALMFFDISSISEFDCV